MIKCIYIYITPLSLAFYPAIYPPITGTAPPSKASGAIYQLWQCNIHHKIFEDFPLDDTREHLQLLIPSTINQFFAYIYILYYIYTPYYYSEFKPYGYYIGISSHHFVKQILPAATPASGEEPRNGQKTRDEVEIESGWIWWYGIECYWTWSR